MNLFVTSFCPRESAQFLDDGGKRAAAALEVKS